MIRRWRRGVVLAPLAVAVAAGVLLTTQPWSGEEAVGETVEYRVCNVVVEHAPGREENRWQPGGLKVTVTITGDRGWTDLGMRIEIENMPDVEADRVTAWHESGVTIDGETGAILSEVYDTSGDEALIEPVLATVRVEPIDPATAPWPYTDRVQVPPERFREGNLDYRLPDPGAGLVSSAYLAGAVLGALFFGWLTDRIGQFRDFVATGANMPTEQVSGWRKEFEKLSGRHSDYPPQEW